MDNQSCEITEESIFQEVIDSVRWDIGNTGPAFLNYENQKKLDDIISRGRRLCVFTGNHYYLLRIILTTGAKRHREYLDKLRNQPRVDAQRFIGKKNIRQWLFNRDKHCLRCGTKEKLTVDHIVPINKDGKNRLYNLQTLCRSFNSWKSDNFIDYR